MNDNPTAPIITKLHPEAAELYSKDTWGEHPDFTHDDWRVAVAIGDTLSGYWTWLNNRLHSRDEGESGT